MVSCDLVIWYSLAVKIAVKDTIDNPIETEPVSRSHTTNLLDTNLTIDDNLQSFSTSIKHNNSSTATRSEVLLGFDILQY